MARAKKAPPPAETPPEDRATAYAQAVAAGEIMAGPAVRDACARHLRDLVEGPARGLVWDVTAAARVLRYFEKVLKLNGGEHEGVPFRPLDWQAFILGSLFGWKASDGFRRFRQAYVETGKGSGKSPLAGGIGHYMLTSDGEPRAEIYAAASKRDQAAILFRDAVAMWNLSPWLKERLQASGGAGKEWNLFDSGSSSFFRVVASEDGQSGPRPHCALLDEIHEHHDATIVEMMRAGTKGRRQALIYMITNSGSDRTSVCYTYHEYAKKVCSGVLQDDSFFAYVCTLDEGDDPFASEECWPKVNPSLGHTFGMRYLREQVTQARGMPSKEAIVRRLNFCEWTDAATPWIDRDLWDAAEADFDINNLAGTPCVGGLDLSAKRDLTAFAAAWQQDDGTVDLAVWFWTPGDTLDERARTDNVPYRTWVDEGHLFAPPGRTISKAHVAVFVQQFAQKFDLTAMAFDQAQIEDFVAACDEIGFEAWIDSRRRDDEGEPDGPEGAGLRMVRHGQGFAGYNSTTALWMPRSIGEFEDLIIAGRIRIHRNPVLRWNSASAVLVADAQNNRKWDKQKATGRIDGMVAATQAVGLLRQAPPNGTSMWDRAEMWESLPTVQYAPKRQYLRYVRDTGGAGTVARFTDDFAPIGAAVWAEMLAAGLVEVRHDGAIRLTAEGRKALDAAE